MIIGRDLKKKTWAIASILQIKNIFNQTKHAVAVRGPEA